MDYSYLWLETIANGDHVPNCCLSTRGQVSVYHDNKTYYYKKPPKGHLNSFKGWLLSVFAHGITRRITGRYPHYTVEDR